jgi:N-acetylglutamate synthase-like GNAT family acetyltransferase
MTPPVVRPAVGADVPRIAELVVEAYAPYVARIGRRPAPMDADYGALVDHGAVRVAEDDGEIVGVLVTEEHGDHLLLENVAVSPRRQGRGVGALLIETAERLAAAAGMAEIRLYTNAAMTENLKYYPRRGFVETHRGEQSGFARVFYTKQV